MHGLAAPRNGKSMAGRQSVRSSVTGEDQVTECPADAPRTGENTGWPGAVAFATAFPGLAVLPEAEPGAGVALDSLADPGHPLVAALRAGVLRHAPGLGPRGQSALAMTRLSYFLGLALFAGAAGLAPRLAAVPHLALSDDRFLFLGAGPGIDAEAALQGPVAGLARAGGLSRRALERVAADGIAAAALALGRFAGREAALAAAALQLLKRPGSPFLNRQLRLERLDDRFVRRCGGCCRIYESPGHTLCPGCVLMPREKQDAAFRALFDG